MNEQIIVAQARGREQLIRVENRCKPVRRTTSSVLRDSREGVNFAGDEARKVWESCQELRAHLNAALLLQGRDNQDVESIALNCGTINQVSGGISYTEFNGVVVVQLPVNAGPRSDFFGANGLHEIFTHTSKSRRWLVDFSGVNNLAFRTWAALIGFKDLFAQKGGDVELVWMREEACGKLSLHRIVEIFTLAKRADHWFSQSIFRP